MRIDAGRTRLRVARLAPLALAHDALWIALCCMVCRTLWLQQGWWPESHGLRLPRVRSGCIDCKPDSCSLVINIFGDGTIVVGGLARSDRWLRDALAIEARLYRSPDGSSDGLVIIRADERVPFRYVRKIMDYCREPANNLWRLQFCVRPR